MFDIKRRGPVGQYHQNPYHVRFIVGLSGSTEQSNIVTCSHRKY